MRKRVKIRPSKPQMILSLVTGVIMVLIGIFVAVPNLGPFGLLWTVVAAGITVVNALPLFSDKSEYYSGMTIEEEDGPGASRQALPASDAEARLSQLQELYSKGLITRDEYDIKRAEILKEL